MANHRKIAQLVKQRGIRDCWAHIITESFLHHNIQDC